MKKGIGLVETLVSLLLASLMMASAWSLLRSVTTRGKENMQVSGGLAEGQTVFFLIDSLAGRCGQKMGDEEALEVEAKEVSFKSAIALLSLQESAPAGAVVLKGRIEGLRKGQKMRLGTETLEVKGTEGETVTLELPTTRAHGVGEVGRVVKSHRLSVRGEGLALKVDGAPFQMLTEELKNLSFRLDSGPTLVFQGKERRGKEWREFIFYAGLPFLRNNGGGLP